MSASDLVAGYYWCRYCEIATPGSWELFRRDAWGRWEEAFNSLTDDWTALSDSAFRRGGYEVGPRIPEAAALSANEATIEGLRAKVDRLEHEVVSHGALRLRMEAHKAREGEAIELAIAREDEAVLATRRAEAAEARIAELEKALQTAREDIDNISTAGNEGARIRRGRRMEPRPCDVFGVSGCPRQEGALPMNRSFSTIAAVDGATPTD